MPDNRKPLIYGAFSVCRNYTVRAHLRQHVAVGGLRPEGCAGVARPLGHQDDREHLRPSGHTPQAFHRQRLGTSVAAIEAVKNKKAPNPFGFDAPANLDSHLWSEWRESNSRPLEPHTSELQNCTIYDRSEQSRTRLISVAPYLCSVVQIIFYLICNLIYADFYSRYLLK